jgi:PRC-barrel domain protein
MRAIPIAAAVLLMLAGPASAGLPTLPNQPGTLAQTTPQAPAAAVNPLARGEISTVEGTDVYGDDGKLGYVSTALMDPQTKKIDRLVVAAGGVLGIGGHRVAIPVDQFTWDADKGAFRLSTTMASLRSMPEWVEGAETATGSSQSPRTDKPPTGAGDGEKTPR